MTAAAAVLRNEEREILTRAALGNPQGESIGSTTKAQTSSAGLDQSEGGEKEEESEAEARNYL
jgi:hypothetical protein